VLGICFGHQLLGQALGGRVDRNPFGREMGSVPVELVESEPLLGSDAGPFLANTTHVDSVVELPPGARVLARTEREPHAALRFAARVYGVQFHPEIDGEVMRHYLEARRDKLDAEGFDADALIAAARDTPAGAAVLARFASSLARRA
jgi:GMP synthase (glutamine-hydrolysing)